MRAAVQHRWQAEDSNPGACSSMAALPWGGSFERVRRFQAMYGRHLMPGTRLTVPYDVEQ